MLCFVTDAISCYNEVLGIDPHAADGLVNLGNTYREIGRVSEAIPEYLRQLKRDEEGYLLKLLLQCAEAVSADNFEEANTMLLEISELSTPFGTSAQRVGAYFSEAMSARLVSSCLRIYASLPTTMVPPRGQKMASTMSHALMQTHSRS